MGNIPLQYWLLSIMTSGTILYFLSFNRHRTSCAGKFNSHGTPIQTVSGKDFAYYTQTEECIPEILLQDFALGNASLLDVYVLSYKKECKNTSPEHVFYIYNNKSSWTTGRNQLWRFVRDLGIPYKYHIFMDDDARLINTEDIHEYEKKHGKSLRSQADVVEFFKREDGLKALTTQDSQRSAWRRHENTLLEYSPAFSTVNVCEFTGKQTYYIQMDAWRTFCGNTNMPPVTVTIFFDAIIMAYHHEALPLLFPMYEKEDRNNWWESAKIQAEVARRILRGQGISNWRVSVFNTAHRPYPRNNLPYNTFEQFIKTDGRVFANLTDPNHGQSLSWTEIYFGRSNCGKPLKFPVQRHYLQHY